MRTRAPKGRDGWVFAHFVCLLFAFRQSYEYIWVCLLRSACMCVCVTSCAMSHSPSGVFKKKKKALSESWCDPLRSLWSLSCHLYRAVIVGGSQPCVWPTAAHKIQLSRVASSKSPSCWSGAPLILGDSEALSACWNGHEVGDKLSCLILCYGPFKPLHKSLLWGLNCSTSASPQRVFITTKPRLKLLPLSPQRTLTGPGTLCVWLTTRWDVREFRLEISPELKFQPFFYSALCQREALVTEF